jgi:ABC-type proline/glycine betaine transport system substrate-binding protein
MASRKALQQENIMLCEIIQRVRVELEQYYAQMKLMDLENGQLHQKAFIKDKRKAARSNLPLVRHAT